jgi:putative transposase
MLQVITAKLKLNLTTEQKTLVSQTALAYRDALNYTSRVAFDAGQTGNGALVAESCLQRVKS